MRAHATRIGTFVAAVLVMLTAREGAAQSSGAARPVFAGASAAWNIDHSAWSYGNPERVGGALAVGLTFGANFADRWSVQVEGELPTSDQTVDQSNTYGSGYSSYQTHARMTYRTPTVAVLFGVHWRLPKRVDIAFQFGPCWRNEQQAADYQYLVNGIVTESHQYSDNDWQLAASLGVETAVALTSRVAVVGQVRIHGGLVPGSELDPVVRPAIGVRVRF